MQRFFDHIFAYYDLLLPISSDLITNVIDFKYSWIIPNVDIKKGKKSHFFGEIALKASPPIYLYTFLFLCMRFFFFDYILLWYNLMKMYLHFLYIGQKKAHFNLLHCAKYSKPIMYLFTLFSQQFMSYCNEICSQKTNKIH